MTTVQCKSAWLTLVVVLFLASFFLPAVSDDEWGVFMGYQCAFGFPFAMMHPAWYGNVFLIAGIIAVVRGTTKGTVVVAILACGLAASPAISSGFSESLHIGYWSWFGSFLVFFIGSLRFELPSDGNASASRAATHASS